MRCIPEWKVTSQDNEKNGQSIYDLCFNPDGTQLIVASGNHVLVYECNTGNLLQTLKGHKDKVYSVNYSKNGQKFASGSADKTVIIWSNKLEGLLKYSHNDSIQCICFNPLSHQLASCAISDFGFWGSEQKSVIKYKINSKINTCSWTNDGQYLALGLNNGIISIRNKLGEEKSRIERNNAPVWALSWNPSKDEQTDILCVTDWNKMMSFYTLGGKLIGKERIIGYEALKVNYFPKGEYILISGLNKSCILYTKDGIKLDMIGDPQNSWIWCCCAHPQENFVAMGSEDGTITYYHLIFNTVHSLYKERYAFRENMTDVIIQHLITEQKVRIKCKCLIKKIAIDKHRLAVQLPERVVIYELFSNDTNDMHYRVKEKITQKLNCTLLVVCTEHLIVCQEKKLQSMFFTGVNDKEWNFDSSITYIKTIGGPSGREGMVLGLKNGQVWQVHLDNIHPLLKVTISESIRCLDLSHSKEKLAVVDDTGLLQVFNLKNGELFFQEPDTNSVAFNNLYEDMIAFSGNISLSIKVLDFPAHHQRLNGFVVGLSGSKVFCLNDSSITTLELALSASMYQYIEKKMFNEAYDVACLGVTDGDWEDLAYSALESLEFNVARLAFIRLQNYTYLELIQELLEQKKRNNQYNEDIMIADVLAYRGKFKEAAKSYLKAKQSYKALTMYTDLRMFDLAQEFLGSHDNTDLIRQKANWAKNINEYKAAADMYLSIGDTKTAIEIYGEKCWIDELVDLGRKLDKADRNSLLLIAEYLKNLNYTAFAGEIYKRLGDSTSVLKLHIENKEWHQAFDLIQTQPQYKELVYIPYAHWLAENDKFVQAQKVFHMAGKIQDAFKVLDQLIENAIIEKRFNDAGYYYWLISKQYLDLIGTNDNQNYFDNYKKYEKLSNIYYTYYIIYKYLEEPFTSYIPESLLNISKYLINEINNNKIPNGISTFSILYCIAKQARQLGANKFAKLILDKIQNLRIPIKFQEQIEISIISTRARPYSDPEELLPMCYRCSTYNPLTAMSNRCVNCGQNFIFSFINFEILPLVEFQLEDDISDLEAIRLIETPPENNKKEEEIMENQQTLQLDKIDDDPFSSNNIESNPDNFTPIIVSRNVLLSMDSSCVLILKWKAPLKYQYYRNLIPDLQITLCYSCFKVFHVDDFELQMLQKGYCPYCRAPSENSVENNDLTDDLLSKML